MKSRLVKLSTVMKIDHVTLRLSEEYFSQALITLQFLPQGQQSLLFLQS